MIVLQKNDISHYIGMDVRLNGVLQILADGVIENEPLGRKEDSYQMYHTIQCYETKPLEKTCWESHEHWIDIQYIISGQERIDVLVSKDGIKEMERKEEVDCIFYQEEGVVSGNKIYLKEGMLAVFYPEDIHRPRICVDGPQTVEKVVFKVRVS